MEQGQASIGEMIRFSWSKSKEILFPFHFKRWLKILIIVWLAAAGVQGINFNWNAPTKKTETPVEVSKTSSETAEQTTKAGPSAAPAQTSGAVTSEAETAGGQAPGAVAAQDAQPLPPVPKPKINTGLVILMVAGALVFGISFFLFFTWLSARFHFILLDVLVERRDAIRAPFREHREIGNSFFKWSIGFLAISLGVILILLLLAGVLVGIAKGNPGLIILTVVAAGLLILGAIILMMIIGILLSDFVAPIMYSEKIPTAEAFNKFLEADDFSFGAAIKYLLVLLGLWIFAGIVQTVVTIVVGLCGLIVGAICFIPGLLLAGVLPFLKIPLAILGGFLLVALILAVGVMIGMIMLPVAIFFRTFALSYLTRLYPDCDLLKFSSEAVSHEP